MLEQLFHSAFPLQIFDLLSCLQSVLRRMGGEKQPETFNCSTVTGVKSTKFAICSARPSLQKLCIKQVAHFSAALSDGSVGSCCYAAPRNDETLFLLN